MVGTVGSGFRIAEACDSRKASAYPFGHGCDDAVSTNAVAVGVGDVDVVSFVGDAVGGVVVGPAHEALTFERREASHESLCWRQVIHNYGPPPCPGCCLCPWPRQLVIELNVKRDCWFS